MPPHCYRELEGGLRKAINEHLIRGKIDTSVFVDNSGIEGSAVLNKEIIQGYLSQLSEIRKGDTTER